MKIRFIPLVLIACVALAPAFAEDAEYKGPDAIDLKVDGKTWLRTMCGKFDPARADETYKVYTHLINFEGTQPITKGPGGKYPHHRGLFIGWKDTMVNGTDYDTWHMTNSYQQIVRVGSTGKPNEDSMRIDWRDMGGKTLIEETRKLEAKLDEDRRVIDFSSVLTAVDTKIELKGDLQHAGMHVRMAQEVADRDEKESKAKTSSPESTTYVLPEGAQSLPDDKVTGAWWVCCSCVVEGKRYWILHMSPPSTPGGVPVYSIRKYARFGSFFEPTLEPKKPLDLHFRIVLSEKPLDQKKCQALYDAFAKERP